MIKNGMLSFKDVNPNVRDNPLPRHGAASVNMVEGCPGKFRVFQVEHIRESLIRLHQSLRRLAFVMHQHDYDVCEFCSREVDCPIVKEDIQKLLDQRVITITY